MSEEIAAPAAAPAAAEGSGDIGGALDAVRVSALDLLASMSSPPSALRVRAGAVAVEMEWAQEAPAPQPATVPAPRQRDATEVDADAPLGTGLDYVCAPTVGVFYRSPEPGAKPFVDEGDAVRAGQQVAIVEAMKLMIPVEADRPGRIVEVLQPEAASVEYGERLFAIAPIEPS